MPLGQILLIIDDYCLAVSLSMHCPEEQMLITKLAQFPKTYTYELMD